MSTQLDEASRSIQESRDARAELAKEQKIRERFSGVDIGSNSRGVPIFLDGDERAIDPRDRPGASWGLAKTSQTFFNKNYDAIVAALKFDERRLEAAERAVGRAETLASENVLRATEDAKSAADRKAKAAARAVAEAEEAGRQFNLNRESLRRAL